MRHRKIVSDNAEYQASPSCLNHGYAGNRCGVPNPTTGRFPLRSLYHLRGLARAVRGCLAPHPESKPKRSLAPSRGIAETYLFAGTDQRGSALELLQREQPQSVAHQHRYTVLSALATGVLLKPADGHGNRPRAPGMLPSCRRRWGTTTSVLP
jgi:hypothetical protein